MNELTVLKDLPLSPAKFATSEALSQLTTTGYLARVQLLGGNSEIVKEGKFPIGHFAVVVGKNHEDLTTEFNAVILSWRPKAMQFRPDILSYYDPTSKEFKEIIVRANEGGDSGCGYGPEFLLWLPDYDKFALFFCSNVTARNEAGNIHSFMHKVCTFKSELIKTKKYTWHGPRVSKCDLEVKMPDLAVITEVMTRFNNPPVNEIEQAPEENRVQ